MWMDKLLRRRTRWAGVVLAAAMASVTWGAAPEVLTEVPGDAYAVAVVGNMRTLSNKLANAAARLEIALPSPDLVGYAARTMGINAGLDDKSSAALVLLKPPPSLAADKYFEDVPPAVLILPATDPKQVLKNFAPTEPDKQGISQVSLPDNSDEKGFAAIVDKKWVVFGMKKEDLAAYLARKDSFAKTASPDTLKVFEANDFVLWGNVEKLGAGADKWLDDETIDRIGMLDLQDTVGKLDPMAGAMQKHGFTAVFDVARRFLADSSAGMVTVRLTDSGVTLGLVADFKADSPMGKFVASQAGRGPVTLKGLPNGKFIAAAAAKWNSETLASAVGPFLDSILTDPALAKDPRLAEMRKSLAATKQMLALTQGTSMLFLEPTAGGKEGLLNGAVLIDSSDPKQLFDLQMQNATTALAQQALNTDLKTTVAATPNALTVKNVSLAKITMNITARPNTPDQPVSPQDQAIFEEIQRIYGPGGMTVYLGVVGKRLLLIYGSNMSTIESAVAAAQADSDALANSPEITGMKDQLVANPIAVAYLPIARWVTLAESIVAPAGGGRGGAASAPAPAAAKSPPVVISTGVTGKMITAEIHVPIAAITSVQDAFTQLEKALDGAGEELP
jgi:hypothetical protein